MPTPPFSWKMIATIAAMGFLCLSLRPHFVAARGAALSQRMQHLPSRTLWVWERKDDLSGIEPATTAIASLDETIILNNEAVAQPRRQPVAYPSRMKRIAVVRIEVVPGARLDAAMELETVEKLLKAANQKDIAALQVDFDAARSQRRFYTGLLSELRRRMPAELPLSMTALASWCSNDDWIGGLPVDEAVPMFFRMEPDRRHASALSPQFRIREPKCLGSAGVSTREPWPEDIAGKRVYVFADRGWREELPLLAKRGL
jgi:hypothetical protein